MPPEHSPDELERELAARLAAQDEERARTGSAGAGSPAEGLPPEAAARLQGAIEGLARLHARWPARPPPEGASRPFGKFLIVGELGRGGHGIVFRAVDPDLDRRVALKVPRPELLEEPDWRRRFLREARALARLDHPGIVDVLEVGEVDGVCYIASADCDGPNLTEWLEARGAPLDPRDAAQVARQIAEAIGHAHARGVVHRDLKPRNILMPAVEHPDDPEELGARPRVTDFGLAKLIEAGGELTRTGTVLGTPRYMAPEQREARHDIVGPPADVYAIGVILDEMLSGRPGSPGDDADGAPPDPDATRARHIPRGLRAIVGKCLESEPARRYADAGQLAADLDRFLSGRRVRAGGLAPRRILVLAGRGLAPAMIVLAIALLAVAGLLFGRRTPEPPDPPRIVGPSPAHARWTAERSERERQYVEDLRLLADVAPWDLGASTYRLAMARTLLDRCRQSGPGGDQRTWEWYHFQLMLHGEQRTLTGHVGAVYHLEYSRDGTKLASSGTDGVRVWDVPSGAPVLTLREHSGDVNWVAFSPDGTRLATAGDDRTVRVWSVADGRRLLPPLVHRHEVVAVVFARSGRHLVAGDRGGTVMTWDASTGAPVGSHQVSVEPLQGMDLSPDGSILATAATSQVALWDYPALRQRSTPAQLHHPGRRFDCVAFSHDGRRFATCATDDQQVQVWDTSTGQLYHSFTHHADERAMTVAFSVDDRALLSTGSDDAARVWHIEDGGRCIGVLAAHGAWVWSGAFAPDGKSVATGGGEGAIKLWSFPHRGAEISFERPSSACLAMAYSSDGRSILTATAAGPLEAWDPSTGSFRGRLPVQLAMAPTGAAFAPGAWMVAVAGADGTLMVGEPLEERPSLTIPRATAARACLTFSADGRTLAYVDADGAVTRLDLTERPPRPLVLGSLSSAPTCLAFAPDGGLLAGDVEGRLFDLGRRPGPIVEAGERGHRGRILALVISPDGSLCATGGEDSSIVLWDRRDLRVHARLDGHGRAIDALAFTPDGRSIVSIADCVQLWNVALARATIRLASNIGGAASPSRLAISPDGTSIAGMVRQPGTLQGLVWRAARPGGGKDSGEADGHIRARRASE